MNGYRTHSTPGGVAIEGPDEDAAYDDWRQRVDDAEADGRRAGRMGLGSGLGSHLDGKELDAFNKGFAIGAAERATEDLKRIQTMRRAPCVPCTCGGRGICRDAQ